MLKHVASSARSWLPFLLRPQKSLKNVMECLSTYSPQEWEPPIQLLESGIKLGLDILIPAILLSLLGSFLPASSVIDADGYTSIGVGVQRSMIDAFSPYTPHASALSSLPPTSTDHPFHVELSYLVRFLALSILSPITMDIIFNHFTPVLMQVFSRLRVVLKSQKGPDASTKAALLERVQTGRVIRRHAYDLYLPPKENNAAKSEHNITSLLFFPGFGICHSAYADVASRLSDCGIPVAVVSLEPLRLAHKAVCGGMDDVMRLIKSAGNEVVHYYKHNIYKESANIDGSIIVEWALGGHSMGGYNALQLAEELLSQTNPPSVILPDGSISRVGSQIVAWAAGNMIEAVPDLQGKGSTSSPLRVFILFASNDDIAKFTSQEQKQQLLSKLPKTRATRLDTIKGGTHSGFASYSKFSMRAQQKEASMLTARFLLDK